MIETINHALLLKILAPPNASNDIVLFAKALADCAIFVGPCLLILVWVLGESGDRRSAVAAAASALMALGLAAVLSSLYFHPRPFMDGLSANYLQHRPDSSFPSDHATMLFAIAVSLRVMPPPFMKGVWIAALTLAVVVSWSRVFLGVHYPLDILGGALLGFVGAAIAGTLWGRQLTTMLTRFGERIYEWPLRRLPTTKIDR